MVGCVITNTSYLYSVIDQMYLFSIPSTITDGDINLPFSHLCYFSNEFFKLSFGQWKAVTSLESFVLFSAIDRMDHLRICLVDRSHWQHLYVLSFLCHWSNGFLKDSFGQWQEAASLIPQPLLCHCSNGSFRSSKGRWWHPLYLCFHIFY